MAEYDALVVGAGPAGSAAAILCAQGGLRVALFEQALFPRARPGETLHPGIEALFEQLGVAQAINQACRVRHTGHWVKWASEPTYTTFGEGSTGYQLSRALLDELLLKRAQALGVQVMQPCRVTGVLRDELRVVGVQTDRGDFTAKAVIDASGPSHWLARQLGMAWRTFSPRLVAHYGYATGTCLPPHIACGIEATPFGWYWTAMLGPARYHWTRLSFSPEPNRLITPPPEFRHLTATGPVRGCDVTWRLSQQTAGNGFFIAGDAAFVLDPSSSHGVLKALMSGMMAAHALTQTISTPWHQLSIEQHYQHWIVDLFERDRQNMSAFYRLHPFAPTWMSTP